MRSLKKNGATLYIAESFLDRMRGLIGREALLESGGLLLTDCNWVHSFLMKNSVDLYFVDSSYTVVSSVFQLNPFRFSPPVLKARHVLEVKSGLSRVDSENILNLLKEA
jgi:uncharacterized protein